MRESSQLEFKQDISNSFLKTVTAFANYQGGRILFGIADNGEVIGLENLKESALAIENKINDTISPKVDYTITIKEDSKIIDLSINSGEQPPYFYHSKSYKRNDTATVEMDNYELKRLILKGQNQTYDALLSPIQTNLTFRYLESKFQALLDIKRVDNDILKTLELMNRDGYYTNAGSLLADQNTFNIIDMVRFGDDYNTILSRQRLARLSLLEAYDLAVEKYREYYHIEVIQGAYRHKTELIPENAFREAVANALVHRDWSRTSYILISMNKNEIIISSPGGLPEELTEIEYLESQISVMRNPIIGNVFFRLDIIESFGTGIRRIKTSYNGNKQSPIFNLYENSVEIRLPVIYGLEALTDDQNRIYQALENKQLASSDLSQITGFGKNKVLDLLNDLIEMGYVKKIGRGRGTRYKNSASNI